MKMETEKQREKKRNTFDINMYKHNMIFISFDVNVLKCKIDVLKTFLLLCLLQFLVLGIGV